MRTCIITLMSSNFSQVGPSASELSALERLKYPHRLIMGKIVFRFFLVVFDPILLILAAAGNKNMQ